MKEKPEIAILFIRNITCCVKGILSFKIQSRNRQYFHATRSKSHDPGTAFHGCTIFRQTTFLRPETKLFHWTKEKAAKRYWRREEDHKFNSHPP